MEVDTDPNAFLLEITQICDELSDLNEAVSTERLTIITLDALPAGMYSAIKLEARRGSDSSLEQTQWKMRTILINHSERMAITKKNQESKRYQESNLLGRKSGRESAM